MEKMRHIGKIANTDERCVIAFMQIPNRADHALVIPTDTLPPRFEQAVMDILKSAEGQNEETFAIALSRRLMPDTGKDILTTLHENRMLRAVPCNRILMMPLPNQPIKLTDILARLGRLRSDDAYEHTDKFNQHTTNLRAGNDEQQRGIANNLLVEARLLETEAQKKRELAYSYSPNLRPVPVVDRAIDQIRASEPTIETSKVEGSIYDTFSTPKEAIASPKVEGTIYDSAQLSLDALLQENL